MINNVRTQNLRDFTVQIRPADTETIVGTGMVVSADGKVVTCAHVVKSAGVEPRVLNGKELSIYFPQALGGEKKNCNAKVIAFFPDFDDDVVLLQLTDGSAPLGPERMPVLGTAEESQGNAFRSYGYRRLEDYIAGWADGKIQGHVDPPPKRKVQGEPVQLESNQINRGMSGSAVLDIERNLVVGIISETWFPDKSAKDSDTAWAVDSRVLSLAPLGLTVQDASLPLKAAPEPRTDEQTKQQVIEVAQENVAQRSIEEKNSWNSAPSVLPEWTGRDDLLKQITDDWNNPQKHVTGLIGFGGEGKSSLARKWVADVIARSEATKQSPTREEIASQSALAMTLDGVFWWGFYENKSVDEFLEAALKYMSGGRIDPRAVPSSNLRAQIIGAMLGTGKYLFVLDGLEVMQHQEGDQYGLLQSNDLRDLLTFFARLDNQSFCLITSRAPMLDLMDYTTYTHRDVDRLSEEDGYDLLVKLGVNGTQQQLDDIVSNWNGHALTLSLIGSYLVKVHQGNASHVTDFDIEEAEEVQSAVPDQYKHVGRILRRYDEHLTKEEKAFLILFSVFRTPVHVSALEKVFRTTTDAAAINAPLTDLSDQEFNALVERLVKYSILHFNKQSQTYTTHPLIRNHYFAIFTKGDPSQEKTAHTQIKDYYLSIAGDTPQYPALDDLKPLIEVVHHACQAGAYDDAWKIYWERISQQDKFVIIHQLGAYETALTLMMEFFSDEDSSQEPAVSQTDVKRFILNAIGLRLMSLGRLREAVPFFERKNKIALETQDWNNLSIGYQNLADLHAQLGALEASAEAVRQALDLAFKSKDKKREWESYCYSAKTSHLRGEITNSETLFSRGLECQNEVVTGFKYLMVATGIWFSDFMYRIHKNDEAYRVGKENLDYCTKTHQSFLITQCHRILGDLDFDSGNHESARAHYESALKIARGISKRDVLIEALLARGRFLAKTSEFSKNSEVSPAGTVSQAFSDLNEALGYCVESGYRIYEADVRVAFAWAYLADLTPNPSPERRWEILTKAKQSAERALQMSNEMGYHWGKVDAKEVLERIESSE
ncbi:MAG: trypsin-like peptidase domain-containing protein [Chloroflexota bacterium]